VISSLTPTRLGPGGGVVNVIDGRESIKTETAVSLFLDKKEREFTDIDDARSVVSVP
jgi:hypothetical protein